MALKPGKKISVVREHSAEEYGKLQTASQTALTFYDLDLRMAVTLPYGDIKKLKRGYGGYNGVTHRHTDRTRALIVGGLVVAALVGLVIALATASN